MLFLFRYLSEVGVQQVDVIYSDPNIYTKQGGTEFTKDKVYHVRQVEGFEGSHNPEFGNDITIIGSGYDDKLIKSIARDKANSRKYQIFGFPSLQPDMFQENVLRAYRAEEALGGKFMDDKNTFFAPANDPFVTASVISGIVEKENNKQKITNLYLSPLSTKAQTLGFVLFYLWECDDLPVSIIYPFCKKYNRETTSGLSRIWLYTVQMPPKT